MDKIKMRIIDWLVNDASEEQIEGLEDLLFNSDIAYGLERIIGRAEYQDFIKEALEEK